MIDFLPVLISPFVPPLPLPSLPLFFTQRERTAFVFTPEMAYAMGGRDGKDFQKFLDLSAKPYNILRRHAHTLINL